jgi:hypothetical protein
MRLSGAPQSVWTFRRREMCLSCAGIRTALHRIPSPASPDTNAYLLISWHEKRRYFTHAETAKKNAFFLSTFFISHIFFFPPRPPSRCSPSQLIHNQASDTASPPRIAVAFSPSSTPLHFHQQPPPIINCSLPLFHNKKLQNKRPYKSFNFLSIARLISHSSKINKKRKWYLYAWFYTFHTKHIFFWMFHINIEVRKRILDGRKDQLQSSFRLSTNSP